MGNPSVILSVQKQPNADTLKLTREIEAALSDLKRVLPKSITTVDVLFRQASFIEVSINNVLRVLVEALIVVAVVLFLFLMNWRTTAHFADGHPDLRADDGDRVPAVRPHHQHHDAGRTRDRHRRAGR